MTSSARPKVGRVPDRISRVGTLAPQEEERTLLEATQATRATFGTRQERITSADLQPPRVWDSRFALFFVLLLVLVNVGLVALLHHSHKTVVTSTPGLEDRPSITNLFHKTEESLAVTPPEDTPLHVPAGSQASTESSPPRDVPAAGPASYVNQPARSITTALPPSAEPETVVPRIPESQMVEPKNAPGMTPPETTLTSPVATAAPVISPPPAPPAQVKAEQSAPAASSSTDNQNLLSIINKE